MALKSFIVLICTVILTGVCVCLSKHIHSHKSNRERAQDGAYAPTSYRSSMFEFNELDHPSFDHESIIGSVKEAEEFDQLSEEESRIRLSMLLTKMDINNDSFIEPQELYFWIVKSLIRLSKEEAEDFFEDADLNDDGEVTFDEQISDTFGINTDITDLDKDDQFIVSNDKRLFEAADLDNNLSLNKTEYIRYVHPEDYPEMFPVIINNTLFTKDKNQNGVIDFEEFMLDSSGHDKESLISEKTKFTDEYDKNHDGILSDMEILAWIVPNNTEVAVEETKHLFASADDNKDNKLSFDEILDHHDIFVGSEVTDFGEHLDNINEIMNDEL